MNRIKVFVAVATLATAVSGPVIAQDDDSPFTVSMTTVEPNMDQGRLFGCSVNFKTAQMDAKDHAHVITLFGHLTLHHFDGQDLTVGLKLGVQDGKQAIQAPKQAYLNEGNVANVGEDYAAPFEIKDEPGFTNFTFALKPRTKAAFSADLDSGKVSLFYGIEPSPAGVNHVTIDVGQTIDPATRKIANDSTATPRWRKCVQTLMADPDHTWRPTP